MKKSEAIQKLMFWVSSNESLFFKSPEDQWHEVLNFMVNGLGMLPPGFEEEEGTGYASEDGGEITQLVYLHKWEEE